ncbi:hypothetical protein YC2023_071110 [Brassica napus]
MRVTTELQPAARFRRRSKWKIHRKHTGTGSQTSNSNQRESNRLKQKSLKKKRSEKCFNRINRLQSSLTIEHRNRGRRIDYKGEEQKSRSNETGITPVRAAVDTKEAWRGDKSRQSETEEATETQRQKPPVHRRRRRRECRSQNPAG